MKYRSLVLALALGLSGCDAAQDMDAKLYKQFRDDMGPMTFAFVPGYKVTVDTQTFPIYGKETCPKAVTAKVFIFGGGYDYPGEGTPACVVVHPETEKVYVRRMMDSGLVDEIWRVERDGEETLRLWTPDGKAVVAAGIGSKDAPSLAPENAHKCVTAGPNSPIVAGANSVVVIDGKTYAPGQSADCAQSSNNISTHGANSPIVTGAGSKVIIHTER